jgi:hypothetical protein
VARRTEPAPRADRGPNFFAVKECGVERRFGLASALALALAPVLPFALSFVAFLATAFVEAALLDLATFDDLGASVDLTDFVDAGGLVDWAAFTDFGAFADVGAFFDADTFANFDDFASLGDFVAFEAAAAFEGVAFGLAEPTWLLDALASFLTTSSMMIASISAAENSIRAAMKAKSRF